MPADQATTELSALFWLIAAGDQVAFQRLYDAWAARLYALALRITGDARLASDVLHATLLQIWRTRAPYSAHAGSAEGWLIAQLRSRAIELMRRRQREGQLPEIFSRDADLAAGLARLGATADGERMAAAMLQLEKPAQEILVLAFLDGLSLAEIAQKLRQPIGTVRDIARRSLGPLRAVLENPRLNTAPSDVPSDVEQP
jgi:RNA polymerase sigma-70 factor (ECF subfamily)